MEAREHVAPTAQGTLAERPVEQLLVYVDKNALTGSLAFDDATGNAATLELESGRVAKIRTRAAVHLGAVLYELGLVDADDLNTTLAEMGRAKRLHGEILRERGAITAAELAGALAEQTTRKVATLAALPADTRFAYFAGARLLATWGAEAALVSLVPGIWRGLRDATAEPTGMTSALDAIGARTLELAGDGTAGIGFSPEEARLAARLVEPRTLSDFVRESGVAPTVARRVAYMLLLARRVTLRAPGEPERRPSDPRLPAVSSRPSFQFRVPSGRTQSEPTLPGVHAGGPNVSGTRAIPEPPRPSGSFSAEEIRRAVLDKGARVARESHFEVLEIGAGATVEEARAAYFRLSRLFHPDKLPPTLDAERDACAAIFARIDLAYRTLTDPALRAKYVSGVHARSPAAPRAKPMIEARGALARGDFAAAAAACARGVAESPDDGDLLALAAWARANCVTTDIEERLKDELANLERAIELTPLSADARYYRAELNRRLGRPMHALRDYREALELNPHHVDAAREMRLFNLRVERGMSKERALSPSDGVAAVRPTSPDGGRRDSVRDKIADWLTKK